MRPERPQIYFKIALQHSRGEKEAKEEEEEEEEEERRNGGTEEREGREATSYEEKQYAAGAPNRALAAAHTAQHISTMKGKLN